MATLEKFGIDFALNGLTKTLAGLDTLTEKTSVFAKKTAMLGAVVSTTYFGFERLASAVVRRNADLDMFTRTTGLSAQELERWSRAAQLTNINLDEGAVLSQVEGLQKNITKALMGMGGNVGAFQLLGVNIQSGDAFEVLEQVRANIKGLSDVQAIPLLEQMGIGKDLLPALRLSNQEFEKLSKNRFLSIQQRNEITALGKTWKEARLELVLFREQGVAKLAPLLEGQFRSGLQWLQDHKEGIFSFFQGGAQFAGLLAQSFGSVLEAIGMLLDTSFGLPVLIGAGGLLMLRKFPLITTFTILAGIIDDVIVGLRGGDSVFGDFLKWFKELPEGQQWAVGITAGIVGLSVALGGLALSMGSVSSAWKLLKLTPIGLLIGGAVAAGFGVYDAVTGKDTLGLGKASKSFFGADKKEGEGGIGEKISNFFLKNNIDKSNEGGILQTQQQSIPISMEEQRQTDFLTNPTSNINNAKNVSFENNISIVLENGDPEAVRQVIQDEMEKQNKIVLDTL